jgi:uncharacterized protein
MPSEPEERLDRRDFMIASATIGASAALVVNARSENAETSATPVGPAPGASSATVYTGDTIQGKKVVSALDVNDLEPGQKHLLYFQGVQMPTGQYSYVSVTVAKGAKPGKRVVLVSIAARTPDRIDIILTHLRHQRGFTVSASYHSFCSPGEK